MTKINIQGPGASIEDGNLQIKDGLPIDGTLQNVSDVSGNDSALQISTDRIGVEADSTATTQSTAVIQSSTTNAGIAIVPNGTGAITANIPDGTAVGGNARGQYAVDLQTTTNLADRVASGDYSVISGGRRGKSSGLFSVVGGGDTNFSTNSYSTISGGASNNASSQYSTISGGQSNTASTNTHATVVGGSTNTASGQYSVAGGRSSQATGGNSVALGGTALASNNYASAFGSATASGIGSFAGGGLNDSIAPIASGSYSTAFGLGSTASGIASFASGEGTAVGTKSIAMGGIVTSGGDYSFVTGDRVGAYLFGQCTSGGGRFSVSTDAQQSILVARKLDTLASAATTVLSLDGSGTTNLIIPSGNNRAWNVVASWVAVVTNITGTATGVSVGDVITQCNLFAFKKIGGVSSVVGSVTNVATHNDASMATASMGYTAGASQELALTFTAPTFAGGGSITLRIVNKLMLTEVAY